jgi:hypothetical protein
LSFIIIYLYNRFVKITESVYTFAFKFADITNDSTLLAIDQSNPVIQEFNGQSRLAGDAAFYVELNRVLGNLHLIRAAHPGMGTLVSFVIDAEGNSYKVTLT